MLSSLQKGISPAPLGDGQVPFLDPFVDETTWSKMLSLNHSHFVTYQRVLGVFKLLPFKLRQS